MTFSDPGMRSVNYWEGPGRCQPVGIRFRSEPEEKVQKQVSGGSFVPRQPLVELVFTCFFFFSELRTADTLTWNSWQIPKHSMELYRIIDADQYPSGTTPGLIGSPTAVPWNSWPNGMPLLLFASGAPTWSFIGSSLPCSVICARVAPEAPEFG